MELQGHGNVKGLRLRRADAADLKQVADTAAYAVPPSRSLSCVNPQRPKANRAAAGDHSAETT